MKKYDDESYEDTGIGMAEEQQRELMEEENDYGDKPMDDTELQGIVGDTPLMAVLPTVASAMDEMLIAYYFDSVEHFGSQLDDVAMSPAFQQLVTKASSYGELTTSRLLVAVD